MAKKRLIDKIIGNRIFWIAVSFAASIILWMYVTSNEMSDSTKTISGVPVVFVGEEQLRNKNLVITNIDTSSVTLTIKGKQRALNKLNNSNVSAQIDVSTITRSSDRKVAYQVIYPAEIERSDITEVTYRNVENIGFFVDTLDSRKFEVKVDLTGTVKEGYIEKTREADPETVTISGAKEQLDKVSHALVTIDRDELDKSIEGNFSFRLVDAEGGNVDYKSQSAEIQGYTTLESDGSEVYIRIIVQMIKKLELKVDIQEGGGASHANLAPPEYSVEYVTVAGEPEILEPLYTITVGSLNLSSFASSYEETYPITYPNGVEMISGETEVTVKFSITGLLSKTISTENIEIINIPQGYEAQAVTKSLEVTVRAPQQVLSMIAPNNIRAIVDLSDVDARDIKTGSQKLAARVTIDRYPEAGVVFDYTVIAIIEEDDDG